MATGVGLRIRERRKELMLSQEALAKRMGLKSKSTICKIERGEDNLTADTIAKYAVALNSTPAYLMGWVDDPHGRVQFDMSGIVEAITESTMQAIERGELELPKYYEDDETAEMAQTIFENEDMRLLFDAAKDSKPEDIKRAADFLKMLKATNPEG